MQRERLTLERIRRFSCPAGKQQGFLWDAEMPRLAVRVTATGAKSFIFETKLDRKTIRLTIGDAAVWKLDEARAEACRLQTIVDAGRDPRQVKAEITAADEAARAAAVAEKAAKEEAERRDSVTLGEAWQVYCEARRPKWGERNYRDHQKLMLPRRAKGEKTLEPGALASLATLPLSEITAPRVATWLDAEVKRRPTQAALGYRLLRAFLNWCADHPDYAGIAASDACTRKVSKEHLPRAKAKDDALQREQLRLWFGAVRSIRNRRVSAYLQGLLITGARPNELAGLQWSGVDFQWHSLTIRDKVDGERTIPLTPHFAALLHELRAINQIPPAPFRILHGRKVANDVAGWMPSPFVFGSTRSLSGRIENAGTHHREALRNIGIPHVTLHGLRRSFGSLSEWCEVPTGIVAQIMGHKPSATAEKHYRVRPLDLLRMWHTRIEGWMLEQAGIEQPGETSNHVRVITNTQT